VEADRQGVPERAGVASRDPLYRLGEDYFVQDGHHRVSVYRLLGVEWLDAEVTEFRIPNDRLAALAGGHRSVAP